jgi:hypothetical protein
VLAGKAYLVEDSREGFRFLVEVLDVRRAAIRVY